MNNVYNLSLEPVTIIKAAAVTIQIPIDFTLYPTNLSIDSTVSSPEG